MAPAETYADFLFRFVPGGQHDWMVADPRVGTNQNTGIGRKISELIDVSTILCDK